MKRVPVLLAGLTMVAVGLVGASVLRDGARREAGTPEPPAAPPGARRYGELTSLADATFLEGRWYLLDGRTRRILVLRHGEPVAAFDAGLPGAASVGRPRVLLTHFDTLVVLDRRSGAVDLHAPDGTFLHRRALAGPGCAVSGFFDAVSTPEGIVTLAVCPGRRLNSRAFAVLELPGGGGRVLASSAARATPGDPVDPYFTPVLARHARGIAFGSAREACLSVVDLRGTPRDALCHGWVERLPVPPAERAELRRARIAARALGARLASPDGLPPFDRIFPIGGGRYAYRAPARENARARRLLLPGPAAERMTTLPAASRVFAAPGEVLLAWLVDGGVHLMLRPLPR